MMKRTKVNVNGVKDSGADNGRMQEVICRGFAQMDTDQSPEETKVQEGLFRFV